jgi:hypothetical protein
MEKKKINSYIKTYSSQKVKYFIITFLSLSFLCIGVPLIFISAMKDTYPYLQSLSWLNYIQQGLIGIEVIFLLSIIFSYILKERKKVFSLMLFDITQWMLLLVLLSGMYFAIIVFIDDYFSKFLLIFPYLLGALKVVWDVKKKTSRQQQAESIMKLTEKIGAVIFFLIIIIRWILTIIFPENKNFSLIAVLSPLFIVAALVFYTEYQWERITLLKKVLNNQEKYRMESDLSINDWYGSKSKEYMESINLQ